MNGLFDTKFNGDMTFNNFLEKLSTALFGNAEDRKTALKDKMKNFDDNTKYTIMTNDQITHQIETLLEADKSLLTLLEKEEFKAYYGKENNKKKWDNLMGNLAVLQSLSFLDNKKEANCDSIINDLTDALNGKIGAVNSIMESRLNSQNKVEQKASDANAGADANLVANAGADANLVANADANAGADANANLVANNKYSLSSIFGGGNKEDYSAKYLKYKQKYIQLRTKLGKF
jgi:hypothetical protein